MAAAAQNHTAFAKPVRRILSNDDLAKWQTSETYSDIVSFIEELSHSVRGKTNDAECEFSDTVQRILNILDQVEHIIEEHPVVKDKNSSRFGKVEFRDFYDSVTDKSSQLLYSELKEELSPFIEAKLENSKDAENDKTEQQDGNASSEEENNDTYDVRTELCAYFNESWGNRTRIDYGSGHELNFICFLLCLKKLNILQPARDSTAIVLKVFTKYITIMRILQREYWLEPAGSHGVWGLDDYHFLPFLFGASQLATHPHLRPKSIHNSEYVDMFKDKYIYFHCIWFINQIKTASLRWHSPMLDDISGVKTWSKVAEGMVKMYKAEVLGKLPIIQHFFFGTILKAPEGVSPVGGNGNGHDSHQGHAHGHIHTADPDSDEGLPVHQHTWGDCCGIKLPSAIAAHQMESQKNGNGAGTIRPIPFD